jgi:hypothetical protein
MAQSFQQSASLDVSKCAKLMQNCAGNAHGKGVLRDSGISIFRGTMANGMKQGAGIHVFHNKMIYKGNFHEDKWHGLGMLSVSRPSFCFHNSFFFLCVVQIQASLGTGPY